MREFAEGARWPGVYLKVRWKGGRGGRGERKVGKTAYVSGRGMGVEAGAEN